MSILHKFRSIFLSPNSPLELWLRTVYHRLSATRFCFHYQDWQAKRSYRKWLAKIEAQEKVEHTTSDDQPTVSFLLDYSHTNHKELLATIRSIQNLDCSQCEIIIFSHEDENKNNSESLSLNNDKKIRHINPNNGGLPHLIAGTYLVFCTAGDKFHPHFLSSFYQSQNENSSADIYYSDCDYLPENSSKHFPFLKPAALSPELLLSVNYLSRSFIRKDAIGEYLSLLSFEESLLSAEYDIIFHLVENGHTVQHIPNILLSQSHLVEADHPSYQEIIKSHLDRVGLSDPAVKRDNAMPRFSWQSGSPSVSIIIPTRNHLHLLKNLISSIYQNTDYQNFTIKLVDNNSDDEETLSYYEDIKQNPNISIIPYHGEFNYSQAINLGAWKSLTHIGYTN